MKKILVADDSRMIANIVDRAFRDNYEIITSVKPGLTGYWQVNGRSGTDFNTRMKMDMDYIHDRTLWKDAKFLIKTFLKIFVKEGAI